MALLHYLQLALTKGLGPITIGRMIEAFGTAEQAASASVGELQRVDGIGTTKARTIHSAMKAATAWAEAELGHAAQLGFSIICPEDPTYPPLLQLAPDRPAVLYVRGTLEPRDVHSVAVVGSRRCSFYGREQAERFGALLAGAGVTVVSGGARGVDSAAHRGALAHPLGRTIAVLGSGLDVVYPPENKPLFDDIARRGAVLSEYPLGTPPTPENFPRRNRIVAGMSRAVLVVEADEKSGALITARQAIEDHNRPVLAIPGRVDNKLSAGPHKLIREGATLAANLEDVLEALGPLPASVVDAGLFPDPPAPALPPVAPAATTAAPDAEATRPPGAALSLSQALILQNLGVDPANVDWLVDRTQLSAQQVLQDLTLLSLRGLVRRIDGQTYAARKG
jgi:DNA processing protein